VLTFSRHEVPEVEAQPEVELVFEFREQLVDDEVVVALTELVRHERVVLLAIWNLECVRSHETCLRIVSIDDKMIHI